MEKLNEFQRDIIKKREKVLEESEIKHPSFLDNVEEDREDLNKFQTKVSDWTNVLNIAHEWKVDPIATGTNTTTGFWSEYEVTRAFRDEGIVHYNLFGYLLPPVPMPLADGSPRRSMYASRVDEHDVYADVLHRSGVFSDNPENEYV